MHPVQATAAIGGSVATVAQRPSLDFSQKLRLLLVSSTRSLMSFAKSALKEALSAAASIHSSFPLDAIAWITFSSSDFRSEGLGTEHSAFSLPEDEMP